MERAELAPHLARTGHCLGKRESEERPSLGIEN